MPALDDLVASFTPPPPGVIDPVQDAINALLSIQSLVGKANAAGGTLSMADWATVTKSYEAIAADVKALSSKQAAAPTSAPPGMSPIAAGAIGAIAGLLVGGVAGAAIAHAAHEPAPALRKASV